MNTAAAVAAMVDASKVAAAEAAAAAEAEAAKEPPKKKAKKVCHLHISYLNMNSYCSVIPMNSYHHCLEIYEFMSYLKI